ncbi:MAG: hypothetical protein LBH92_02330 [Bacteroidales bacterium]|jgi:hypothetical protein|nr:hypothetical protein [Bacteroidales bacterium]
MRTVVMNDKLLLNEYDIVGEGERMDTHYKYMIEIDQNILKEACEKSISPGIMGVKIVEKYVSKILGKKAGLFLIQGNRFFLRMNIYEKQRLVLNLSISKIEKNEYSVSAEISDNENILMEVNGCMSSKS